MSKYAIALDFDIRPCPICYGEVDIYVCGNIYDLRLMAIKCPKCKLEMHKMLGENCNNLITRWNTRAE